MILSDIRNTADIMSIAGEIYTTGNLYLGRTTTSLAWKEKTVEAIGRTSLARLSEIQPN